MFMKTARLYWNDPFIKVTKSFYNFHNSLLSLASCHRFQTIILDRVTLLQRATQSRFFASKPKMTKSCLLQNISSVILNRIYNFYMHILQNKIHSENKSYKVHKWSEIRSLQPVNRRMTHLESGSHQCSILHYVMRLLSFC